jgi:hypothetical protein
MEKLWIGAAVMTGVRLGFATLLTLSGCGKLRRPIDPTSLLAAAVAPLRVQRKVARALALALAVAEVVLAGLLVIGWHAGVASAATAVLLFAFAGVLAVAKARGYHGACQCFGSSDTSRVGEGHLLFLIWLGMVAAGLAAADSGAPVGLYAPWSLPRVAAGTSIAIAVTCNAIGAAIWQMLRLWASLAEFKRAASTK